MAACLCRRTFLNYKNRILQNRYSTGYVVLVPEAPDDVAENEVFSRTGQMVEFDKVEAKDCKTLLVRKSQMYDVGSWELGDQINSMLEKNEKIDVFKNVFGPLELLYVPFMSSWGLIETLHHANDTYMPLQMYKPLTDRAKEISRDKFTMEPIYKVCKKFLEEDSNKYSTEEKRLLQKFALEGTLSGMDLSTKDKGKYQNLLERIKMRTDSYYNKWNNAMAFFKQVIYDPQVIHDFPPDLLRNTALDVEEPEKGPWILSLKPRVYNRFMEYCDTRQSRLHMWLSKRQICSKHGDPRFRADLEVEDLRHKRTEFAKMFGYPTYAHLVMKSRMAETLENVHDMLETLLEKAKIGQEAEVNDLEEFARGHHFAGQIELWDIDYWGRMQKKDLFHFDEVALQEYFPLSQVMLGLFALCEQLFGIVIEEEKNINAWHKDVRYFRVLDERTKQDLGGFFFDPFARGTKKMPDEEGGLCVTLGLGSKLCGTLPSVSLIFDFAPPTEHKPSLLLFKEVEDLFYTFGYALQHILSDTPFVELSGIFGLERDACSICAKFLRNWVYEKGTLESVSGHYDTGEPLPAHILEGIVKMQNHLAGTKLCNDIYMAHLDMSLHIQDEFCMPIVEKLWPEHFLFDLNDFDHHPFGLKDLYIENNACNYYTKVWSDVVAADAFSAFEEAGFRNHEEVSLLGKRFRSTYFALAGGCHPSEVFRKFRGRNPSTLPFLNLLGLKDLKPTISPSTEPSKIAAY